MEVDHCLSAMPGVRARDLARVVSDPRALAHCDPFLRAGLPGVVREAVHDTTAAAKLVAEHRWMCAAPFSPGPCFASRYCCYSSPLSPAAGYLLRGVACLQR